MAGTSVRLHHSARARRLTRTPAAQVPRLVCATVSDLFPPSDDDPTPNPSSERTPRWVSMLACSLVLVVVTVVVTLSFANRVHDVPDSESSPDATKPSAPRPNEIPLEFGSTDTVAASVDVPPGTDAPALLKYDVDIEPTPAADPRAAMVSFRVECSSGGEKVEMQADGKTSTNVFVSKGGNVSGQALTDESDEAMECRLLVSAPYIEVEDDGLSSLRMRASLTTSSTDGVHTLALHRLDDATLFAPGSRKNVLSLRIDDPSTLDRMSSTVRLTSCTVVGGSRDGGGTNKCLPAMTGRESSTARIRVIARWLDEDGNIESTSTYWDETVAIDYNTHHVPWSLSQEGMGAEVPENASAVVLVVQVESIVGTPFVVHADGTDAVVSTRP